MQLRVHHVNQAASGGSYVVVYDAEVQLKPGSGVVVTIGSVDPPNAAQGLVAEAKQAIQQGAEHVLLPRSKAAHILVRRLVVYSVDFKTDRFAMYTAHELEKLLTQT